MTVLSSGEGGVPPPPPPPISISPSPITGTNGTGPDQNLLLLDIRNGITLKPTKTRDKSTPAFIKKSNGVHKPPSPPPTQAENETASPQEDMKDALQEELRSTLRRKIKKQDVEMGNCAKNDEIEKAMTINRTEIQLKVNTSASSSPSMLRRDASPVVKSPLLPRAALNTDNATNGNSESLPKPLEIVKSPVLQRPPAKPERTFTTQVANNAQINNTIATNNGLTQKEVPRAMSPVKSSIVKPATNSKLVEPGTLKKVPQHRELKIDVNSTGTSDGLKNAILSPEVKSGYASIRPSQIKTLTKQGSLVSHTDIVEQPKPVIKSPIALVESPKPYHYSPPTPKASSSPSSGQSSPRTPTRTTILDTKFSRSLKSPLLPTAMDPNAPMKKLLISHPKASFTLPRTNKHSTRQTILPSERGHSTDQKPVFRILTALEQAERSDAVVKSDGNQQPTQQQPSTTVKADVPGTEPVLTSYVSFAKDLANAPNNYPDKVTTKSTTTVKQDLFFDNMNLRDIKIDIVENGQLRVTNK
ncbi:mucin-2-like [Wyeomyia smithii]|uniref:mucin-2-like n=1 Tax=Wyeomyia smithii TaxID=174621 RepID=UPI002467EAA9|nr:mucin-2-like [Wyeomyia smithii]